MELNADTIMGVPVHQLPVSPEFMEQTGRLGFNCLNDIIAPGWGKLLHMEHFSYRWFNELVDLLHQHQLLHTLENYKSYQLFGK